jgi:Ca2+-binding EF-hand superfamily protein
MQPEQCPIELNFAVYEQRLCASLFVALANKERRENLTDFSFQKADGTFDPLQLGLPRRWDRFDQMEKAGIFRATYKCSPEDRKFHVRKQMFEDYGFWKLPVEESQVMWWADINSAPNDVLEFLTFVCRSFESVEKAFRFIDGEGGNGEISLTEFREGIKKMKFKKFDPSNKSRQSSKSTKSSEEERIKGLFRYLDPSGEGSISLREFDVLKLLWNEVNLCIREFVQFLVRTIGDDLDEVWGFFDDDGSGEIDADEWVECCKNCGYFGPVMPIFRFLDQDGQGSIESEEFSELAAFQDEDLS